MLESLIWSVAPKHEEGVITGADTRHEWMIPWWWENYSRYNSRPVEFFDLGMSEEMLRFCRARGTVTVPADLPVKWCYPWYLKPLGLLESSFERMLWLDVDCEIRGNLDPFFDGTSVLGLAVDPCVGKVVKSGLMQDEIMWQSGTVRVARIELVQDWARISLSAQRYMRGDQEALARAVLLNDPEIDLFDTEKHLRLRLQGDTDCLIMHWTGSDGKKVIRNQIENRIDEFVVSQEQPMVDVL